MVDEVQLIDDVSWSEFWSAISQGTETKKRPVPVGPKKVRYTSGCITTCAYTVTGQDYEISEKSKYIFTETVCCHTDKCNTASRCQLNYFNFVLICLIAFF